MNVVPVNKHKFADGLWAALWSAFSALVLLQTSPWVVQTPGNDNGIFLYFGSEIRKGKLPFVDLWDHKPPLVFYLDALGFALGGGSRWGVWGLEVVSLTVASTCAFFFLRRYFRAWPAFIGVAGMLANLAFVLEGGNLTEEYALAFQFGALFLFAWAEGNRRRGWPGLWIGVLMGCAFLLKQTLIGVWLALVVYLFAAALFARQTRGLIIIAQMAAGFMLTLGASFAYFALRGGLSAYWDVAFWFNFVYSSVAMPERVGSLLDALWFLNTRAGFFILAAAAWLGGIAFVLLHHEAALWQSTRRWAGLVPLLSGLFFLYDGLFIRAFQMYAFSALSAYRWGLIVSGLLFLLVSLPFFTGQTERRLYGWLKQYQLACDAPALLPVYLAIIDLPVELAMVSVSGRGYLHYYLSLFPPLAILVTFLAWTVVERMQPALDHPGSARGMPVMWSAALLLPVLFGGLSMTIQKIHPGSDLQTSLTVRYIRENTQSKDTVLLWGTQTGIYYLSERESPTRYVHQIPLINAQYATPERIGEFLRDIEQKKPALIIDTQLASMPLPHHPGDPVACAKTDRPHQAGMEMVYQFICANYESVDIIGPDSWVIYRYNPAVPNTGN